MKIWIRNVVLLYVSWWQAMWLIHISIQVISRYLHIVAILDNVLCNCIIFVVLYRWTSIVQCLVCRFCQTISIISLLHYSKQLVLYRRSIQLCTLMLSVVCLYSKIFYVIQIMDDVLGRIFLEYWINVVLVVYIVSILV